MGKLYVGIDVGKKFNVCSIVDDNGLEIIKRLKFDNNFTGFDILSSKIHLLREKYIISSSDVLVGFEATGHYWHNLYDFFSDVCNYECVFIKTRTVQLIREIDSSGKGKNDSLDSYTIAKCLKENRYSYIRKPSRELDSLKKLTRTRDELVNNMVRQKNRIIGWLDVHNPVFLDVFKSFTGKTSFLILQKYQTPKDIVEAGFDEIWEYIKDNMKSPRIKVIEDLLSCCKNCGKENVEISYAARVEIELYLNTYSYFKNQIDTLDQKILEEARNSIEGFKYIEEIKAISLVQTIAIIAELGDIDNFKTARQVLNFSGLNLREYSSGLHKGQTKISKAGSRQIRKNIYIIATILVAKNNDFRALYCYYKSYNREKKSENMQMLIAVCCKILKVLYGILKNNSAFSREELFKSLDFSKIDMDKFVKEYKGKSETREDIDLKEYSYLFS